ncbi:hypothetical protein OKW76_11740 [Sphingomonas sp. S1-29]|uniref:hypothetical protein n=1 Tax=Sphingomonas sp. S1-29 TaxID=2991074 RepID=UPI002240D869|nr:hypothetical protein [Sphingomonas sp. S1-29]UZK68709.1 hypothetical protein OKW76_11740 [Sphingomonas sp. S1-29]
MHPLRRLVSRHRALAALLLAAVLAMKMLVPAGYMTNVSGTTITVAVCNGSGPMTITIPMEQGHDEADRGDDAMPCAFAGVPGAMLAATDPVLLLGAILFVLALGLSRSRIVLPRAAPYLRPPLRGPPAPT